MISAIRKCLVWIIGIVVLNLTSGCAVVAIQAAATVPMLVKDVAILSSKPEKQPDLRNNYRQLSYEIEVRTADGEEIMFAGNSDCPAHNSSKDESLIYRTVQPYSESIKNDRRWVLSGISCDDAIKNSAGTKYILYEVVDQNSAKLHRFQGDKSATVLKSKFTSALNRASTTRTTVFNAYPEGPYSYQKLFFGSPLASVHADKSSPTVLCFDELGGCLRLSEPYTKIDHREFQHEILLRQSVVAVEEGFLAYQPATESWSPSSGLNAMPPFDVASRTNTSTTPTDRYRRLSSVRIQLDGRYYLVSKYGRDSLLYVPEENSILLVRTFDKDVPPKSSGRVACKPPVCKKYIEWLVVP